MGASKGREATVSSRSSNLYDNGRDNPCDNQINL